MKNKETELSRVESEITRWEKKFARQFKTASTKLRKLRMKQRRILAAKLKESVAATESAGRSFNLEDKGQS